MFKTRLLSGIVLVILALFLIISGHEILLFATLAISCIGMFELYRVFKMEKTVLAGVGYLAAIVYYCNLQWKFLPDLMILFMAFLILLMFVFVFAYVLCICTICFLKAKSNFITTILSKSSSSS